MLGNMMPSQLTINSLMEHGKKLFSKSEVVSITNDHELHRCTLGDIFSRAGQLANFMRSCGITKGDRVATLAWNDFRHLELYFSVNCSGAVCHTVNPRLHPNQLEFIINDAQDKLLFIDVMFIDLIKPIREKLSSVEKIIVLTSDASVIEGLGNGWLIYEQVITSHSQSFQWPQLNENDACSLCYTSGTTGNPKGVLYSHRALVLQTMTATMPDAFGVSKRDVILPVVPMFHVNAWEIPYMAAMTGCKLVFGGHKVADPKVITELFEQEGVTLTAGVPTVWSLLHEYLEKNDKTLHTLKKMLVGGTAMPPHLYQYFQEKQGLTVIHAWGMTETSPLGTINHTLPVSLDDWQEDALFSQKLKQGQPPYGVDIKIVDEQGNDLPWNGKTTGNLMVRGPWIMEHYFKSPETKIDDGWLDTGDISTIDEFGFMKISDRKKDVIKSGGEWISSVDIENVVMMHSDVSMAAIIGISHPKWDERPLLIIQDNQQQQLNINSVHDWLGGKIAKWWFPDEVVYIDSIPLTATGKVHKLRLREQFKDFRFQN